MSIFSVGGPEGIIVPMDDVVTTEGDVYFEPGIIHGTNGLLIMAWGWNPDGNDQGERIGIKYLWAHKILEWAAEASKGNGHLNEEIFEELINEHAEDFTVNNDGTGDFVTINNAWHQAKGWTYNEVIMWAKKNIA